MSVKIRWKADNIFNKINRLFTSLGDIAGDIHLKMDLAKMTRDMLYKRIKSGKGVTSDRTPFQVTQAKQFSPLSKQYKKYRSTGIVEFKAKKHYGRIHEVVNVKINVGRPALGQFGTPNKSNLTLSGQMLESMQFDIKKYGFVVLIPETQRRGESITNAQLARWLSKSGRPFMNLTAGESRIVKSRMRKQIQQRLKKLLK